MKPFISMVFSFRNEEENLGDLIRRVRLALEAGGVEYEMIFVNDISNDRSLEILEGFSKDPRIKILTMSNRFGPSACVLAGMKIAQGDAIIYMDSDLQDPPELIPQMIEEFRKGADVVNMTRTERLGESRIKMWVTKGAYRLINAVSDVQIPMNTGDFKLLSRRVINQLVQLREHDPFLRGLVRWVGFRQVQIFYRREARIAGKTHFPLLGSGPSRAFLAGITSFSEFPLYLALFFGIAVSIGSFMYLIAIILTRVFLHMHLPGWPAIMVTQLFLGGVILMTVGILGVYVGRIHREVKMRPNFIVESAINCAAPESRQDRDSVPAERGFHHASSE